MSVLSNRTISSFPLSIGTALAMETFFNNRLSPYDPERQIPDRITVDQYFAIYINIGTLLRNLMGSLPTESVSTVDITSVIDTIYSELEVIESLFATEGGNACKPVFYFNDYKHVLNTIKYRSVFFRTPNNATELHYEKFHSELQKVMLKSNDEIELVHEVLSPNKPIKSLILTHQAFDLLSKKKFVQLDLIESHTGKLKTFNAWSSKFAPVGSIDFTNIPFNNTTLFLFGDRYLIQPSPIRLRKTVNEIAIKCFWTSVTTKEKVLFDLEREIKEPLVVKMIKSYPRI
jgi:hypothetical protein